MTRLNGLAKYEHNLNKKLYAKKLKPRHIFLCVFILYIWTSVKNKVVIKL